jgi:hypothetical protein
MDTEIKHPATYEVAWPTGPVNACRQHAEKLVALGKLMGVYPAVSVLLNTAECTNCANEAKKGELIGTKTD